VTPDVEDGGFAVECPTIPGCVSQGDTIEEAMANLRDAIEGCLAVLKEAGETYGDLPPTSWGQQAN
jgi:predicted RNase H-like HicB family nuclease